MGKILREKIGEHIKGKSRNNDRNWKNNGNLTDANIYI